MRLCAAPVEICAGPSTGATYPVSVFKPTPAVVEGLRALADSLDSDELERLVATEVARSRPDLTDVLLRAARLADKARHQLPQPLVAATCRATLKRMGERHPGHSVEVRVPPWMAVQVGFGSGPRHTRGTPPNVVEIEPDVFIALALGTLAWDEADVRASGAHADEAAQLFPA